MLGFDFTDHEMHAVRAGGHCVLERFPRRAKCESLLKFCKILSHEWEGYLSGKAGV